MDDTIVVRWRFHFTLDEGTDPLPAELSEEEAQLKYDILPCAGIEFGLLIPEMHWPESSPTAATVE